MIEIGTCGDYTEPPKNELCCSCLSYKVCITRRSATEIGASVSECLQYEKNRDPYHTQMDGYWKGLSRVVRWMDTDNAKDLMREFLYSGDQLKLKDEIMRLDPNGRTSEPRKIEDET